MMSVAIMAHEKRAHFVPELEDQLGDCEVVWDKHNDRHETGLRSILTYDPNATHHMVIQDDAILCRDLRPGVEQLVELTEDHPVALYMGNVGPDAKALRAMKNSITPRFVAGDGPHWGVGIVLPTEHIPDLATWYKTQNIPNYDRRISKWYSSQEIKCWYTAPSLVQHRDSPSLVQGRYSSRQAAWFIGEDESALDVEWSTEPWTPPRKVVFEGPKGRITKMREGSARHERYEAHPRWHQIGVE